MVAIIIINEDLPWFLLHSLEAQSSIIAIIFLVVLCNLLWGLLWSDCWSQWLKHCLLIYLYKLMLTGPSLEYCGVCLLIINPIIIYSIHSPTVKCHTCLKPSMTMTSLFRIIQKLETKSRFIYNFFITIYCCKYILYLSS